MKILAIKWRRLGDTVLWTSALDALAQLPGVTRVDVACDEKYVEIFAHDPRFGKIFSLRRGLSAEFATLRTIRAERYDWILNFHASSRSAWLARLGGAKQFRCHFHHRGKPAAVNQRRAILNQGVPMAAQERDVNVVRALGWNTAAPATRLFPDPAYQKTARRKLASAGMRKDETLLLLGVGASRPSKQWPLERYAALAAHYAAHKIRVAVLLEHSTQLDAHPYLRERLAEHALLLVSPALSDAIGYLQCATAYVGSDSGIKHVACALGLKTLTLFGPESIGEWHGYPEAQHRTLQRPALCRNQDPEPPQFAWCAEAICPLASHACMQTISTDAVIHAVDALLAE